MNLGLLLKRAERLAINNSPAILTAVGVVGTITTAYFTGKASFKAADILAEEARKNELDPNWHPLDGRDMVELTWKLYILPASTGVLTVAAIIFAHRVSSGRAAALAAAYSLTERAFAEYKDKVVEKIGDKKEQELRDEIAQHRVNMDPIGKAEVIITDNGDQLCYDGFSGRYFYSTMEKIRKAVNDINFQIFNQHYASLTDFYEKIGLSPTNVSSEVGFNYDLPLEVDYSSVLSENNRPCISIEYRLNPSPKFDRLVR